MGNREDLIAGAQQCLRERGWGRTTVRDIVAAAGGVSMAAIGYHFGSREALLNAALMQSMEEWGAELGRALGAGGGGPGGSYEALWLHLIESVRTRRPLWAGSIEAVVQAEHAPELMQHLGAGYDEGRRGMAAWLLDVAEEAVDESAVRGIGAVQMALISGVMIQWLLDPQRAPTASDVVAGVRALAATLGPA